MTEKVSLSPEEREALKQELFASLHCALPGTVASFDPATQTAEIQPAVRSGALALPVLSDVPVFFPGSRDSAITWPVSAGDECLVVLADTDIDAWFDSGEVSAPRSARKHSLSDAFAFVGFRSRPNALPDFPEGERLFPHEHDDRYYTEAETDQKLADIVPVAVGTCDTAAGTAEKAVTVPDASWRLKAGCVVGVKFASSNTFSATSSAHVSLNVNGTGARDIYYNNTASPTGTNTTAFGYKNRTVWYMYDGTYWVWMGMSAELNDNTVPSAYCSTAAGTAAKTASCSGYQLLSKSYIQVILANTNTAASALTLNINSKGAKPVYINGEASGASNYTLPAGSYLAYYDGTNYHFRTDGVLPGATVPVDRGGTGQTMSNGTTSISNVAEAAADCEITTAQYAYWGKTAMVRLVVKKTTAVSSGTTTLCTLVSGKRPKYTAPAQWGWNNGAQITTGGAVQVNGAIAAGTSITILATYILA